MNTAAKILKEYNKGFTIEAIKKKHNVTTKDVVELVYATKCSK